MSEQWLGQFADRVWRSVDTAGIWFLSHRTISGSKSSVLRTDRRGELKAPTNTLDFLRQFWSRDLVQKLRAEILCILAVVARPELNSEAHF